MGMFGLFNKKEVIDIIAPGMSLSEKKSFVQAALMQDQNSNGTKNFEISVRNAIDLYEKCAPFFMVVDKIVTSYSEIPFKLQNKKTKEFIDDHPVLDLLKNPNPENVACEFKESLASMFLITGNVFMMATGNINKEPLEVYQLSPRYLTAMTQAKNIFGFMPSTWQYSSSNFENIIFTADEVKTGIRYHNGNDKELFHMKKFNPKQNANSFFGMSKAYPLFMEMESYTTGNINNAALLKNGARPSMAWVNNRGEELTDDQWDRMQQEAKKYSGADNAGGTPILDGMDVKELGQSNRDMQFKELQDTMLARIANVFGVPLPLLLDSTMTLNNLQAARLHLDKDAVIPLAKKINENLTRFLLHRYKGSENLEFALDLTEIESLKPEVLLNAKVMTETKAITVNEIRAELGYGHIDGGDVLSIGADPSENDEDEDDEEESLSEDEKSFNIFKGMMIKQDNKLTVREMKALWLLSRNK